MTSVVPSAWLAAVAVLLACASCVTRAEHQDVVTQLAAARDDIDRAAQSLAETRAVRDACLAAQAQSAEQSVRLQDELAAADARGVECEQHRQELSSRLEQLSAELDDTTAAGRACQGILDETRRVAEQSLYRSQELADRLERLRAVEQEMRRLQAMHQSLVRNLQALIDAGQLEVRLDRGRILLQLPQDVLFDSGRADVRADGRTALARIGEALAGFGDRRFQVEGHTDNVPVRSSRFANNWDLSTARALAVVDLLLAAGVAPENLSAAGYGEFQPRASNDDEAGRRLNRRIEIVLVPSLDFLAGVSAAP